VVRARFPKMLKIAAIFQNGGQNMRGKIKQLIFLNSAPLFHVRKIG
jgi:hypothetical protein